MYNPAGALDLAEVANFIIPNESTELVGTFVRRGAHPNTATIVMHDERHRQVVLRCLKIRARKFSIKWKISCWLSKP